MAVGALSRGSIHGMDGARRKAPGILMISLLALGVVPHAAHGEDDFNHHLSASVRLYKSLEYEQAMVQLQRAKQLARSTGQNASIALHEGIFLADLGKREESLAAFRAALLLEPEAKLPFKVSPKMVRGFEDVRVRVRMELASALKPEPQGISSKEFMPLSALAGSPARSSPVDRVTLLERLSHDEALLHQRGNPPDGSPAVAQLKQMREQVEQAVNVVQRMDVFVRLEEWERQFLQKEASPASAPLARTWLFDRVDPGLDLSYASCTARGHRLSDCLLRGAEV
jgi:tetratricopeptide (TPR) repeat protein